MNLNRILGIIAFLLSMLLFYLPLFHFLIDFLGLSIFRPFYLNDEYNKKYHLLLMDGMYPHLDLIWFCISIPLLLLSKSSINKFLFYTSLIVQLFILLFNIIISVFFGTN